MCMIRFIIALFILSFAVPAMAQNTTPMTAVALQNLCNSKYDIDVGICAGYIAAVADTVMQDSTPHRRVCLSPAVGPQILMDHVQKYWTDAPPAPQDLASYSVDSALRDRFRCP